MCVCSRREESGCIPNSGLGHKCDPEFKTRLGRRRHWGADPWVRMMLLKKGVCRELPDPVLFQVAALMIPSSADRDS